MGIDLENLHHAYLLIGRSEDAESYVRSLCERLRIKLANNPDFFVFRSRTFGINEARELGQMSARKAVTGKKIFLITSEIVTREAESALLKTFEEPFSDTHFFLAVREEAQISPTLGSRMQTTRVQAGEAVMLSDAEKFISFPPRDRLLFAKKFADEERNLPVFLDEILLLLRKRGVSLSQIERVYNTKRFASDSAVLPRLIIEHLSLVLP